MHVAPRGEADGPPPLSPPPDRDHPRHFRPDRPRRRRSRQRLRARLRRRREWHPRLAALWGALAPLPPGAPGDRVQPSRRRHAGRGADRRPRDPGLPATSRPALAGPRDGGSRRSRARAGGPRRPHRRARPRTRPWSPPTSGLRCSSSGCLIGLRRVAAPEQPRRAGGQLTRAARDRDRSRRAPAGDYRRRRVRRRHGGRGHSRSAGARRPPRLRRAVPDLPRQVHALLSTGASSTSSSPTGCSCT